MVLLLVLIQHHFKNMKKIKYQFEYFCSPIWIKETDSLNAIYENISIINAPLSDKSKSEIEDLNNIYQNTYNDNYPPEPIKLGLNDDLIFTERVIKSFEEMQEELIGEYSVEFNKSYWAKKILSLKGLLKNNDDYI